jgi:hypothetical protein
MLQFPECVWVLLLLKKPLVLFRRLTEIMRLCNVARVKRDLMLFTFYTSVCYCCYYCHFVLLWTGVCFYWKLILLVVYRMFEKLIFLLDSLWLDTSDHVPRCPMIVPFLETSAFKAFTLFIVFVLLLHYRCL